MMIGVKVRLFALLAMVPMAGTAGCGLSAADQHARMARGYVYYLDGAGGGGVLSNYGAGVGKGLADAGFEGYGEMFRWQTGLGVAADQVATVIYKRSKARELANRISARLDSYPQSPVTVMGLSAGTAITAFALEVLPEGKTVDRAIMLSGSLSSDYDLTAALEHVKDRMFVFTSDRDGVLLFLLPMFGTADRVHGDSSTIGIQGVRRPANANSHTRQQYAKIVEVPWRPEFASLGNRGGHTDSVGSRFVQVVIAPLVTTAPVAAGGEAVASGGVANPDYMRWDRFGQGSRVTLEGEQILGQVHTPIRVTATLVSRSSDMLIVEREIVSMDNDRPSQVFRRVFIPARISADSSPATHPQSQIRQLGQVWMALAGKRISCRQSSITSSATFAEWGTDSQALVWSNELIPGGIGRLELKTHSKGTTAAVTLQAKTYHANRLADSGHRQEGQ